MTTHHLLLIIGAPATGKTTLMRHYTRAWHPWHRPNAEVPHIIYLDQYGREQAVQVGIEREGNHSGADALKMDIATTAKPWLATRPAPLVLADGFRLATRPFITTARHANYHVTIAHLTCPTEELDRRCTQRGTAQNPDWRKAAITRAKRLATWAATQPGCTTLTLNATHPPGHLASQLHQETTP